MYINSEADAIVFLENLTIYISQYYMQNVAGSNPQHYMQNVAGSNDLTFFIHFMQCSQPETAAINFVTSIMLQQRSCLVHPHKSVWIEQ